MPDIRVFPGECSVGKQDFCGSDSPEQPPLQRGADAVPGSPARAAGPAGGSRGARAEHSIIYPRLFHPAVHAFFELFCISL